MNEFDQFRLEVLATPVLLERLRGIEDRDRFVLEAVAMGREQGYLFGEREVEAAMLDGRRNWLERWI